MTEVPGDNKQQPMAKLLDVQLESLQSRTVELKARWDKFYECSKKVSSVQYVYICRLTSIQNMLFVSSTG